MQVAGGQAGPRRHRGAGRAAVLLRSFRNAGSFRPMKKNMFVTGFLALSFLCGPLIAAEGASASGAAPPAPAAASDAPNPLKVSATTPAPVAYAPSMPDLMNIGVLSRHEKLGLGGRARNWKYSAYEIKELRNAFARIARTVPAIDGWDTKAMFDAMITAPIKDVEDAIKAEDGKAFDRTYAALTGACNACHATMAREYIVIRVPRADSYPNQDFERPKHAR